MTLSKLAQALDDARKDVATYSRLLAAEARVDELTTALAEAQAQHDRDVAEQAAAAKAQMFAGITNVSISQATPISSDGHLLSDNFTIAYTKDKWDHRTGRCSPAQTVARSFSELPEDVLLYLLEKPELIPADILALDPDSPRNALSIYRVARRKGCFVNGQRGLK
jgi:hypothetical protein